MQLLNIITIFLLNRLSHGENEDFCHVYYQSGVERNDIERYDRIPHGCMFCEGTQYPSICNCTKVNGHCMSIITDVCPLVSMKCVSDKEKCSAKCVEVEDQDTPCKRNLSNLVIPWYEAENVQWQSIDYGMFELVDHHDEFKQGNWCKSCNGGSKQSHEIIFCHGNGIRTFRCPLDSRCVVNQDCNAFCLKHGYIGSGWDNHKCRVSLGNQNGIYYEWREDGCVFCDRYQSQELAEISRCYNGTIQVVKCEQEKQCYDYDNMCSASCQQRNSSDVKYEKLNKTAENPMKPKFSMATYVVAFIVALIFLVATFIILFLLYRNRSNLDDEKILMNEINDSSQNPDMSPINLIAANQLIFNTDKSKKLGEGAFGAVYAGKYTLPSSKKFPVAIKVIKSLPNDVQNTEEETIEEATIMARLDHENLLRLIGICLADGIQIVTLLRPLGALNKFLKEKKELLGPQNLMLYAFQIASAMEYLTSHRIVHRDLAARNVLMKKYNHVEVTDFGLASLLGEKTRAPSRLPVRWVPIECLFNSLDSSLYCEASDVWSFGVTVWEILTFAKIPYENVQLESRNLLPSLYSYLKAGNKLSRPSNCGIELYKTLLLCWANNPESRPKFSHLKETFEQYKNAPYAYVKPSNEENESNSDVALDSDEIQLSLIYDLVGKDDFEVLYSYNENPQQPEISHDHVKPVIEQNISVPEILSMRPNRHFSESSYFYLKKPKYSISKSSTYEVLNQYNKLRKCATYCTFELYELDK